MTFYADAVRDLLTRYFETSREIIRRYGGTVEKFIGDAVMAVWGAPVAHEDDAERAVRAALDLVASVAAVGREDGVELVARAGVLTGEAAVTLGAVDQGLVAGDLVNTAARLTAAVRRCSRDRRRRGPGRPLRWSPPPRQSARRRGRPARRLPRARPRQRTR